MHELCVRRVFSRRPLLTGAAKVAGLAAASTLFAGGAMLVAGERIVAIGQVAAATAAKGAVVDVDLPSLRRQVDQSRAFIFRQSGAPNALFG